MFLFFRLIRCLTPSVYQLVPALLPLYIFPLLSVFCFKEARCKGLCIDTFFTSGREASVDETLISMMRMRNVFSLLIVKRRAGRGGGGERNVTN